MKHIAILAIMLSLCGSMLFAQTVYGARAGINLSTVGGEDNLEGLESKIGVHAGMLMQIKLAPNLIIQPEFLYTMKGMNVNTDLYYQGYIFDVEISDTFGYLEIPVLFKLSGQSGNVKFQPYLGPSFGILMSAKEKYTVSFEGISDSETEDIKEYMNSAEVGINVGMDLVFKNATMLGVRYNMGLTNILIEDDEGFQSKLKNRTWMFNFGYIFDFSTL